MFASATSPTERVSELTKRRDAQLEGERTARAGAKLAGAKLASLTANGATDPDRAAVREERDRLERDARDAAEAIGAIELELAAATQDLHEQQLRTAERMYSNAMA